ncbi:MAG TPA: ABC transporter permease [Candidatus Faecaligallichristensenella faecipullorum]|nr:ABC transporter permease [Candidatus Faecaligallichristensenella faecipullorum]
MFVESVSMSVANIMKNRLRSFLTILGIMIGVTAVIALVTTVSGVSNSISDSFTSMGAGSMTVSITGTDLKSGLDSEDMEEITQLDHVEGVTPSVSLSARVSRNGVNETGVSVSGKNDYYFENDESVIERGRAINPLDIEDQNRVCLISEEMMETFFYGVDPVGETLYIEGRSFTAIGVLSDSEDSSISSMLSGSNDIMIPYTTALKMNNVSTVSMLTVYIDSAESSAIVESELEEMLDALFNYEDDTYTITTMEGIEDTMSSMLSMMSALLGGIASIALVVGGIGIMNMMLTSVTERTVEIGLKKAIGAEPGQIQLQFLIESFLLSMIGGIAGVILGIVLSAVLCSALGITFSLNYGAIILGVSFSAAVGIIFGWSPARKASRLSPIEALRRI